MANLKNPKLIWLKGGLFVLLGSIASGILISQMPNLSSIALLLIAIWSFCRAYYFAFYVIERYVDPNYRFAGIMDFAKYAVLGHSPDRQRTH